MNNRCYTRRKIATSLRPPGSRDGLTEIFVYGTLEAKGTSSNPVVFSDAISAGALNDGWGGIRLLGSGSAALGTYIAHNTDPAKPRLLGSSSGEGWASVRYDHGGDPVISGYQTRVSTDGVLRGPHGAIRHFWPARRPMNIGRKSYGKSRNTGCRCGRSIKHRSPAPFLYTPTIATLCWYRLRRWAPRIPARSPWNRPRRGWATR